MSDDKPYEIGWGRPPKEYQFPKGKSGNPNGGKRKYLTDAQVIGKIRDELITITIKGKLMRVPPLEAAARRVLAITLRDGKVSDLERLIKLFETHGDDPVWLRIQEGRKAGDEIMAKMRTIFRNLSPSPRQAADRKKRNQEELGLIMGCSCCGPALRARWASDDAEGERFKLPTHFRKMVDPTQKDEIESWHRGESEEDGEGGDR